MKTRQDFKNSLDWNYYLEKEFPQLEARVKELTNLVSMARAILMFCPDEASSEFMQKSEVHIKETLA